MPNYIVNTNTDEKGKHEVHETTCGHLPDAKNQHSLGWMTNCQSALTAAASAGYSPADGCFYCCEACHTG